MSVPYELLNNSQNGHIPASERIPVIARPFVSERARKTLDIVSQSCSTREDALADKSTR
jgi:acyl-CoA dehydrogenase